MGFCHFWESQIKLERTLLGLNIEAQPQIEQITSSVCIHFSHLSWEDIIDKVPQVAVRSESTMSITESPQNTVGKWNLVKKNVVILYWLL